MLAKGDRLAATARRPEQLKDLKEKYGSRVVTLALDVTDSGQITAAVDAALQAFGRIDVLVNNAGFGVTGAAEAYTEEQVRSQLETNLYAPIAVTRAVVPVMRRQRSGRILQISSVGGRAGNAGLSIYQAAKFGLGGFTEALNKEVTPLGIRVTAVEPGGFRTDWGGASMTFAPEVEGYEGSIGLIRKFLSGGEYVPMGDPDKAARVMVDLAYQPNPPVHLVLGSEAVALARKADMDKLAELEQWEGVSRSTDHDDATNFLETEAARQMLKS